MLRTIWHRVLLTIGLVAGLTSHADEAIPPTLGPFETTGGQSVLIALGVTHSESGVQVEPTISVEGLGPDDQVSGVLLVPNSTENIELGTFAADELENYSRVEVFFSFRDNRWIGRIFPIASRPLTALSADNLHNGYGLLLTVRNRALTYRAASPHRRHPAILGLKLREAALAVIKQCGTQVTLP